MRGVNYLSLPHFARNVNEQIVNLCSIPSRLRYSLCSLSLVRVRQLIYYITTSSLCQSFFALFFRFVGLYNFVKTIWKDTVKITQVHQCQILSIFHLYFILFCTIYRIFVLILDNTPIIGYNYKVDIFY